MRSTTLLAAFLALFPLRPLRLCAQPPWNGVFDGSRPLPLDSASPPPVSPSDVEVAGPRISILLNADRSDRQTPVWPGFSVFGQPVLLYEDGVRSFLLAHPSPPAGYNAVLASPRPVFEKLGVIPDLRFDFQFHRLVNGIDTFAYRYQPGKEPAADIHTLIHERFHVYQEKGFADNPYERRASEPDGEDLALAALEQKTLKSALLAADSEGSARFVRQFLAVRAARYARQPDSRGQENNEERSEGMANYVEETLMNRSEVAPIPGGIVGAITEYLDLFPEVEHMEKARYYATGAAQGLLLDRGGPRDWKERVAAGDYLYDLVGRAYPQSSGPVLDGAKSEHGYDELLRTGTQLAAGFQALKQSAISAYDNSPGVEWTVAIPWDKDTNFGHSSGSPQFNLSRTETLMPHLMLLDVRANAFILHFTDRPAILGPKVRFHAAAGAALLLDGRPLTLSGGSHPFETLSLAEEGLELSVSRPGTLTVTDRKAVLSYR